MIDAPCCISASREGLQIRIEMVHAGGLQIEIIVPVFIERKLLRLSLCRGIEVKLAYENACKARFCEGWRILPTSWRIAMMKLDRLTLILSRLPILSRYFFACHSQSRWLYQMTHIVAAAEMIRIGCTRRFTRTN
jgi:hypothetical protein